LALLCEDGVGRIALEIRALGADSQRLGMHEYIIRIRATHIQCSLGVDMELFGERCLSHM
jgi:hypothetical protein